MALACAEDVQQLRFHRSFAGRRPTEFF